MSYLISEFSEDMGLIREKRAEIECLKKLEIKLETLIAEANERTEKHKKRHLRLLGSVSYSGSRYCCEGESYLVTVLKDQLAVVKVELDRLYEEFTQISERMVLNMASNKPPCLARSGKSAKVY
jgi:hypothetical protein